MRTGGLCRGSAQNAFWGGWGRTETGELWSGRAPPDLDPRFSVVPQPLPDERWYPHANSKFSNVDLT